MSKRKYIKKEKEVEVTPISQKEFDQMLKIATLVKPPPKGK